MLAAELVLVKVAGQPLVPASHELAWGHGPPWGELTAAGSPRGQLPPTSRVSVLLAAPTGRELPQPGAERMRNASGRPPGAAGSRAEFLAQSSGGVKVLGSSQWPETGPVLTVNSFS